MERLDALLALLTLERLPRTGWLQAGRTEVETVAAHSHGAAVVALVLGPRVEPPLDVDRAVALAVVHDAPEALLGDLPATAKALLPTGVKERAEELAARQLLVPLAPVALERVLEYRAQATREARFARLCDKLHLGLRLVAYLRSGARGLDSFRAGIEQLDCAEFPDCDELRREVLAALAASVRAGGG